MSASRSVRGRRMLSRRQKRAGSSSVAINGAGGRRLGRGDAERRVVVHSDSDFSRHDGDHPASGGRMTQSSLRMPISSWCICWPRWSPDPLHALDCAAFAYGSKEKLRSRRRKLAGAAFCSAAETRAEWRARADRRQLGALHHHVRAADHRCPLRPKRQCPG
jgi:hypothetical protein